MGFERWISGRYSSAKKEKFLSFLNVIAIVGIAIGVASLIIVTSVMTGFGNNLREKIIGTTPHVMIEKETRIKDYDQLITQLRDIDGVKAASPYIQGNVFLESEQQAIGLIIRGVDPAREGNVTKVTSFLNEGSLNDLKDNDVIIGSELARYFGYGIGDELTLIAPGSGIAGEGWRYQLNVVGVFKTGMVDYDMNLVLTNLAQAQAIFQMDDNMSSGVGVRLEDPEDAKSIKNDIYDVIGYGFVVKSWIDINRNLFEALFLEKWGLFIILTLMVLVASFNIVSTLVVTVTSKVNEIGVLKSLGASSKSIRRIFMQQGIRIGLVGTFWGVFFGFGLCYVLGNYVKVPAEIYSIDRVPVDVVAFDMAAIIFAALVITYCATVYPASKAAKMQPVDALRYQ
ncbi:MAG: lipoprotein-releasing system permease protein [Lysobacterales bacterium]|jgi:lipoprotein-releasing system permease protein